MSGHTQGKSKDRAMDQTLHLAQYLQAFVASFLRNLRLFRALAASWKVAYNTKSKAKVAKLRRRTPKSHLFSVKDRVPVLYATFLAIERVLLVPNFTRKQAINAGYIRL